MRRSTLASQFAVAILLAYALLLPTALVAAEAHPIETQLRWSFPSLSLQSSATFDPAEAVVNGRNVPGVRARFPRAVDRSAPSSNRALPQSASAAAGSVEAAEQTLKVQYPRSYDDPIVVEFGNQRVALRPVGAKAAFVTETGGKLLYERPYQSTDAIEVPGNGHSEELLLLRDARAPRVYDYEIVESQGIGRVILDGGAVRFLPKAGPIPAMTDIAAGRFSQPAPSLQIDRPWIVDGSGQRSESHAQWTLLGDGAFPKIIRLTLNGDHLSYPLVVDPSFSATGNLARARSTHTATLLPNGKVLIAGGLNGVSNSLASAELYDPVSGTFSETGSLATARYNHTATLLPNGKVLIAGGRNAVYLASAELYDPAAGTFSPAGSLATTRSQHTATLLNNGKVLIAGGVTNALSAELYDPAAGTFGPTGSQATRSQHTATLLPSGNVLIVGGSNGAPLASAELYVTTAGTFSPTGSLGTGRYLHTATLLANGNVLIVGGVNGVLVATAELYDPTAGTFGPTGSLMLPRIQHSATLLPNGKVLIVGGFNAGSLTSAELYDPTAATFGTTGYLATARKDHTATLLSNGEVMVAGGSNGSSVYPASAERYDPAAGTFNATGSLGAGRYQHTATLLPNGKVLIAGGYSNVSLASAELYDPATGMFSPAGNLATARNYHTATLLPNGKVLIAGGYNGVYLASAELYDPGAGTFSPTGSLATGRALPTATLLPNGKVLIAGGFNNDSGDLTSAELYDPATGTFSPTGSLAAARDRHTATLLPNGKVLIAGGYSGFDYLASAELYNPGVGTFSATGSLATARYQATATLLPNGKVLIAAGFNNSGSLASAELYDPAAAIFSPTGSLATVRYRHTATLLANGKVLFAGGNNGVDLADLASAELYDPAVGTFSATGSLATARQNHTATLLPNGKVLIAGGYNGSSLTSAELYDVGQGFLDVRRPVISTGPFPNQLEPATLTLGGIGFRGDSEASSGSTNSSATNYPLLQLQRIDNEQVFFIGASAPWSDSSFTSTTLSGLPNGHYRVTIITNGIPSIQRLISIAYPAPTITNISPTSGPTTGGQSVTITGTNLTSLVNVTFGGAIAVLLDRTATFINVSTPASNAGTVVLAVNTAGGTASGSYTYVFGAPTSVTATAVTTTSVNVTWPAVFSASSYDVARSSDGTTYTIITSTNGTIATDYGVAPNTSYLYKVRANVAATSTTSAYTAPDLATTVIFNDPALSGITIKAVHITQLRTAVNAVRALAGGMPAATFTDPTITPGVTTAKAAHVNELRSNLNTARSSLSLTPQSYTDTTLVVNSTTIQAQHILDLRNGVQ